MSLSLRVHDFQLQLSYYVIIMSVKCQHHVGLILISIFYLQAQCYNRMKLMVVGYGNRGKTTLLKTLMRRNSKKENRATVGVVVRDWT